MYENRPGTHNPLSDGHAQFFKLFSACFCFALMEYLLVSLSIRVHMCVCVHMYVKPHPCVCM